MNPDRIVAGLDIGSAKTTALIAEVEGDLPKHPTIKILGVGQAKTGGMRKGVVSDIEETTRTIRKAMHDAERMAGAEVEWVYGGIAGEHVQAMRSPAPTSTARTRSRARWRFPPIASCSTPFRRSITSIATRAFAIRSA
jgi:cell division protein FtsA